MIRNFDYLFGLKINKKKPNFWDKQKWIYYSSLWWEKRKAAKVTVRSAEYKSFSCYGGTISTNNSVQNYSL